MKHLLIIATVCFTLQSWAWAPEFLTESDEFMTDEEILKELEEYEVIDPNEDISFESVNPDELQNVHTKKSKCSVVEGKASWYGPGFHGRKTANGERFNQYELTAAHRTLPFNSIVRVTYRGQSVEVRINDRGPFIKGRVIDLSKAAAQEIGLIAAGHGHVEIEVISCGETSTTA